jgi:hypothetical protein
MCNNSYVGKQRTYKTEQYGNGVVKMNIWELFFIHNLQKQKVLINDQKVNDPNPL